VFYISRVIIKCTFLGCVGYDDHLLEQSTGRQEFMMMTDQQPVRDVMPHDLHPTPSHDPILLPGYPGSAEMSRPLQQNRLSYQSVGLGHKHLTNHPFSDSKVSYHPSSPYPNYQAVPSSVYSVPNTPRAENLQPPPSYEVHMMSRHLPHGERQKQQKSVPQQPQSQQRQQLFAAAPTTATVSPVNYHMVDQPHPHQQQPHPHQPHPHQQQPHPQQQLYLNAAPPNYLRSSPVRMTSDVQQQSRVQPQQQFNPTSYAVDTHPVRLAETQQQQASLPAYPLEAHQSLGDQQKQQLYYMGPQGYSSEAAHPGGGMHYSQQLGKNPAHHNDSGTTPISSAGYQIPTTSHMIAGPDSFSHSSQQKAPPPSYESYVRTSVHRQSRSQSPITTASMIPHQHSASDNSLGRSRDPATGVVSDAGRGPMIVRGHSAQGQYSPLLNKTDSKSRSGGDLHMVASDGGNKVLRNTSSGALRRYSGSGYLSKPPQYKVMIIVQL